MADIYNSRPERGPMYRSRWGLTKPRRDGPNARRRGGWRSWIYPALMLLLCAIVVVLVTCHFGGGF